MEKEWKFEASLSIVVPVYNEECILFDSLCETYYSAAQLVQKFQIIIVNDASSDASLAIIKRFAKVYRNVTYVSHNTNKGFGGAIKSGLNACTNEYVICVPVDSPIDVPTLNSFLSVCCKYDVVLSYRLERVGYSKVMLFNSMLYHKVVSILFNLKIRDYNWIHLYRKSIFGKIDFDANGIFMLAEVVIRASQNNMQIAEVSVVQMQRISGVATSTKFSTIVNVLKELLQFLFNNCRKSRMLR
jgi:glycosyltransferase involved in cell wall biosynthesis